jgi:hypothetical protein
LFESVWSQNAKDINKRENIKRKEKKREKHKRALGKPFRSNPEIAHGPPQVSPNRYPLSSSGVH